MCFPWAVAKKEGAEGGESERNIINTQEQRSSKHSKQEIRVSCALRLLSHMCPRRRRNTNFGKNKELRRVPLARVCL